MNVSIIRAHYGIIQIKLPAMTGREFRYLMDSLDFERYGDFLS
jgi:hypothetical protein